MFHFNINLSSLFFIDFFKFQRNELPELYSLANVDYEATFVRIARDIILQVAGNFVAPKYWVCVFFF